MLRLRRSELRVRAPLVVVHLVLHALRLRARTGQQLGALRLSRGTHSIHLEPRCLLRLRDSARGVAAHLVDCGAQPLARRGVGLLARLQQRGSLRLLRLLRARRELLAELTDAPLSQISHGCNLAAERARIVLRGIKRGAQPRNLTCGRGVTCVSGLARRRACRCARSGPQPRCLCHGVLEAEREAQNLGLQQRAPLLVGVAELTLRGAHSAANGRLGCQRKVGERALALGRLSRADALVLRR